MFSAVAEQIGMDYQTAVKVSSGFGGGMYLGSVCGAVTGGIMAIGLKHGGTDSAANARTIKLVREFTDRFKAQYKTVQCPELTGIDLGKPEVLKLLLGADLSKPEGVKAVQDALGGRDIRTIFATCGGYVRDAATIVGELVNA